MRTKIENFLGCHFRLFDILRLRPMRHNLIAVYSIDDELCSNRAYRKITHRLGAANYLCISLIGYNDAGYDLRGAVSEKGIAEYSPRRISGGQSKPLKRFKQNKLGLLK